MYGFDHATPAPVYWMTVRSVSKPRLNATDTLPPGLGARYAAGSRNQKVPPSPQSLGRDSISVVLQDELTVARQPPGAGRRAVYKREKETKFALLFISNQP